MKLKLLFIAALFVCAGIMRADYTISNQTAYPAQASVTLGCTFDDGHYSENTIELDFKPRESKNVPNSCRMKTMNATMNFNGTPVSTGVFSGDIVSGQTSGLLPSWEISASVEGTYSGIKPFVRMVP